MLIGVEDPVLLGYDAASVANRIRLATDASSCPRGMGSSATPLAAKLQNSFNVTLFSFKYQLNALTICDTTATCFGITMSSSGNTCRV